MMEGRHEKVISALLSTNTREEAAEKLGINSRTIRRYFTDPEFLERYNEAAKAIIGNSTQQIQKSAARSLLEYGIRLTEINDIGDRLDKLEEAMGEE